MSLLLLQRRGTLSRTRAGGRQNRVVWLRACSAAGIEVLVEEEESGTNIQKQF